jgi:hypothetical protein
MWGDAGKDLSTNECLVFGISVVFGNLFYRNGKHFCLRQKQAFGLPTTLSVRSFPNLSKYSLKQHGRCPYLQGAIRPLTPTRF